MSPRVIWREHRSGWGWLVNEVSVALRVLDEGDKGCGDSLEALRTRLVISMVRRRRCTIVELCDLSHVR
jgi:hypothetical protein